jgi:triosephosphate isomerase
MRTPLVIGNWKMHGTLAVAGALATALREGLERPRGVEVVVCPPFTALAAVGQILAGTSIHLGAQNSHWEAAGAHTGEIAPPMLVELGCRYVLVGHSERRREMGETDQQVNLKVGAALEHGLVPVLCLGETAEERRQGVALAYEPVWAIGTGQNATPGQAAEVHGYLRGLLSELSSKDAAATMPILYGGSVKAENAEALAAEPEIDGALVGGASLDAASFIAIVRHTARAGAAQKDE